MSKFQAMGTIGKTIGYITWAINNTIRIAKNTTTRSFDFISNRSRYNLEITVQGKTIRTETGINTSQIIALLETMHNFGDVQIHISNGELRHDEGTEMGTDPDTNNTEHSTSEETVHSYDTF